MKKNPTIGADDCKDGHQRPALTPHERDDIGARLRREHGGVVQEPLPAKILYLLGRLGRHSRTDTKS